MRRPICCQGFVRQNEFDQFAIQHQRAGVLISDYEDASFYSGIIWLQKNLIVNAHGTTMLSNSLYSLAGTNHYGAVPPVGDCNTALSTILTETVFAKS